MVIRSFLDDDAEASFKSGGISKRIGWASVRTIARRKLDMSHDANEIKNLRSLSGNRLESLSGDLEDCYSIRINDQCRVVFKWDQRPYDIRNVYYH